MENFGGESLRGPSAEPRFHAGEHRDRQEEEATTLIEQLQEVNRKIAELVGETAEVSDESDELLLEQLTPLRERRAQLEEEIAKRQKPIQ